jgi:RNA polymerase sigma factor (sigma-70 family)
MLISSKNSTVELVAEIQRRIAAGMNAGDLETVVLKRVESLVRKVAARFESSRGSLEVDDLVQVGMEATLKLVRRGFKPSKGGDDKMFKGLVIFNARSRIHYAVKTQSLLVRPSLEDQEAGARMSPKLLVGIDDEIRRRKDTFDVEDAVARREVAALLRACLGRLPPKMRQLLVQVHGIGREPRALRQIAWERQVPKTKVAMEHRIAMEHLVRLMKGENLFEAITPDEGITVAPVVGARLRTADYRLRKALGQQSA